MIDVRNTDFEMKHPLVRIRALVIAHDARATGGVNNFLRVMRVCYRAQVDATRFANGPRIRGGGAFSKLLRMTKDYVNFVALLRQRRFDVLHTNPSLDLSSTPRELVFIWLGWLLQRPMKRIVFYRGWRTDSFNRIAKSRILRFLFLSTHRRVDRVLVLSQEFADSLVAIGIDPAIIFTTTTMFERSLFESAGSTVIESRNSILFLARFLPQKGGVELIEAFARVASRYPNWTLVMGGGGPDRERLVATARLSGVAERIVFPGYVAGKEKARLLNRCSLFALPTSHSEGMPNAILEAMAAGQVIITTPIGGIKDVVKDGVHGTILTNPSVDAIERALELYVANPHTVRLIGDVNKAIAWKSYESSIVADKIVDHYRSCLNRY
jgi:glycosyltransferase involved in cell wall biosynthesis